MTFEKGQFIRIQGNWSARMLKNPNRLTAWREALVEAQGLTVPITILPAPAAPGASA